MGHLNPASSLTSPHTSLLQVMEEDKAQFAELFTEVFNAVDSKQLRPFVRTQYMRTAFQVRGRVVVCVCVCACARACSHKRVWGGVW